MKRHHSFLDNEIEIGKLTIGMKTIIVDGIVIAGLICGVVGYNSYRSYELKKSAVPDYSLKSYTADQLVGGTYYVKTGDKFYPVAPGMLISTMISQGDTAIPKEANPETRMNMYGQDDQQIPTLYKDSQLIYKAPTVSDSATAASTSAASVPTDFWLERFKDEGYSIGIRSLSNSQDGGKYKTTIGPSSFYPGSSISTMNCKTGDEVIIDKIDGKDITSKNVSTGGTITGLKSGQKYKVDAYTGTTYIGTEATADTHMFTSYELYDFKDYSMDQNGYMAITMPDYMWSGYYYINGQGMFRYVNNYISAGNSVSDYNTPYYKGVDQNGNMIVNPATSGQSSSASESSTSAEDPSDFSWNYDITIDNQQKDLYVSVDYSDAKTIVNGTTVSAASGASIPGSDTPSATITSPSGESYTLGDNSSELSAAIGTSENLLASSSSASAATYSTDDTNSENTITTDIKNPETGTWKLSIKGMYARTFDVATSFSGATSNMVVKDSDEDTPMSLYVPEDLKNGIFKFTWENTDHAGTFEITGPDGSRYGNEVDPKSVLKETYGEIDLNVGSVKAGEYSVNITGESLGHVYFTYSNNKGELPINGDTY